MRDLAERIPDLPVAAARQLLDLLLNADLLTEMSDDELVRFVALDIGRATADE